LACTADDRPGNVTGKSRKEEDCLAWDKVWAWNRVCWACCPRDTLHMLGARHRLQRHPLQAASMSG